MPIANCHWAYLYYGYNSIFTNHDTLFHKSVFVLLQYALLTSHNDARHASTRRSIDKFKQMLCILLLVLHECSNICRSRTHERFGNNRNYSKFDVVNFPDHSSLWVWRCFESFLIDLKINFPTRVSICSTGKTPNSKKRKNRNVV